MVDAVLMYQKMYGIILYIKGENIMKFNNGDRVRVIQSPDKCFIGITGTIVGFNIFYDVKIDNNLITEEILYNIGDTNEDKHIILMLGRELEKL